MDKKLSLSLRLEFIWWIFTALVVVGVIYPILSKVENYPFLISNIVFIVVFITFTRYIFLLKHTFLAKQQYLKIAIVLISVPIIAVLVNSLSNFQIYLDEKGLESILGGIQVSGNEGMIQYIRSEMLLFGVGSVIVAAMLPLRMILSVWRTRNRGTV